MRRSLLPGLLLVATGIAAAQVPAYPDKPVKLIVGFPAGGPTDIIARMFAERAAKDLRQAFIVENKPGANSVLAAEAVASAKPDGLTLLVAAQNHALTPALYADRVKFDPAKSFTPICVVARSPTVLVVSSRMGVKSVADFLRKLRDSPGKYTYASVGIGSQVHFATEDFLSVTKTSMVHVPYKGAAPASTALLAGEVDAYFATAGSVMTQVRAGRVVALAVATRQRSALLPDVPTFDEAGVKGFYADVWFGLLAPADAPEAIARALEKEAMGFSGDAAVRERLAAAGIEPLSNCGAAFAAQISSEAATYSRLAKALNLKVE